MFQHKLSFVFELLCFGWPFEFVGLHPRFARSSVELQSSADASTSTEERETIARVVEKTDEIVLRGIPYEMRTIVMK